jgi:ABC-type multidrug transport system fused ATPase/permease subunit
MITRLWLKGLLKRRPGRLLGAIIGVALTVALLASIGAFTVSSAACMTERAPGILIGFGVAQMLVKVLTGVFDPPPDFLYVPWTYLMLLTVAASLSTIVAVFVTQMASHRIGIEALRDI